MPIPSDEIDADMDNDILIGSWDQETLESEEKGENPKKNNVNAI